MKKFIIIVVASLFISGIGAAGKSMIDVARLEEKVSAQKDSMVEMKDNIKEIKTDVKEILLRIK